MIYFYIKALCKILWKNLNHPAVLICYTVTILENKRLGLYTKKKSLHTCKTFLLLSIVKEKDNLKKRDDPESVLVGVYPPQPQEIKRQRWGGWNASSVWLVSSITQSVQTDNPFDTFKPPFETLIVIIWLVPPKQGHVSCGNDVEMNQQNYHLRVSATGAVVTASFVLMSNPVYDSGCKSTNIGAWPAHY